MFPRTRRLVRRIWERLNALPVGLAVFMGVVVFAGFLAASVWGYRKWDYIEHDNNFCLDCHLMAEPFQLFGASAHRDLSCKACHHPNLIGRSKMALTQIIENPDSLTVHAEVTNERCAACHIYGDPEEWNLISRSRGHRVHFESDDPELQGLMCVECHSTSVHQFSPTDGTCQDCHTDANVIMAGMNQVVMHCGACHAFNAPLESIPEEDPLRPAPEGSLQGALRPGANECLSCHAMRTMVAQPAADDPHGGECGSCHNPHTQESSRDALSSCANAGCHDGPLEELSPFHVGIGAAELATCTDCHAAHGFHADGGDCLSCHADVFRDGGTGRTQSRTPPEASPHSSSSGVHPGVPPRGPPVAPAALHLGAAAPAALQVGTAVDAAHLAVGLGVGAPYLVSRHASVDIRRPPPSSEPPAPDSTFRHAEHRGVDCLSCHSMTRAHGEVRIHGLGDCRQCHHTPPRSNDCSSCHAGAGLAGRVLPRTVTFAVSVGEPFQRSLPFDHGDHGSIECASCHAAGPTQSVASLDCTSCHAQHHVSDAECGTCHTPSPRAEHTVQAHLGCGGTGCHDDSALHQITRTRSFCLVCHDEQEDHKTDSGLACVECHALPEARTAAGVGP